eukprot:2488287-Amphidinium_carterae.1
MSCLNRALGHLGYDVKVRLDGHPDEDRHAQKLVLSNGGYSCLIGKVALAHGGTIVGEHETCDRHWADIEAPSWKRIMDPAQYMVFQKQFPHMPRMYLVCTAA